MLKLSVVCRRGRKTNRRHSLHHLRRTGPARDGRRYSVGASSPNRAGAGHARAARRRRASPPLAFVGDAMDATDAMGETVKIRWRARKDVAMSQAGEGLYVLSLIHISEPTRPY